MSIETFPLYLSIARSGDLGVMLRERFGNYFSNVDVVRMDGCRSCASDPCCLPLKTFTHPFPWHQV